MNDFNETSNVEVMDEADRLPVTDDTVIEFLRGIKTIPDTTYQVNGEKVFVFDNLVKMFEAYPGAEPEENFKKIAASLALEAEVSAIEAVELWRVVPEPYDVVADLNGDMMILHRQLNAWLPGTYKSGSEINKVLATLLVGGIIPGDGEISFHGQQLTPRDRLGTLKLTPMPAIDSSVKTEGAEAGTLGTVTYLPGFEAIPEHLFDDVKARESEWLKRRAAVENHVATQIEQLWPMTTSLPLSSLNGTDEVLPEDEEEEFVEFRKLFPELAALTDGSMYELYQSFQIDVRSMRGWDMHRDEEFVVYLFGRVAGDFGEQTALAGQWFSYSLLRGETIEEAACLAQSAVGFNGEIEAMARQIANAIGFMEERKSNAAICGPKVVTVGDRVRSDRNFSLGFPGLAEALAEEQVG